MDEDSPVFSDEPGFDGQAEEIMPLQQVNRLNTVGDGPDWNRMLSDEQWNAIRPDEAKQPASTPDEIYLMLMRQARQAEQKRTRNSRLPD